MGWSVIRCSNVTVNPWIYHLTSGGRGTEVQSTLQSETLPQKEKVGGRDGSAVTALLTMDIAYTGALIQMHVKHSYIKKNNDKTFLKEKSCFSCIVVFLTLGFFIKKPFLSQMLSEGSKGNTLSTKHRAGWLGLEKVPGMNQNLVQAGSWSSHTCWSERGRKGEERAGIVL